MNKENIADNVVELLSYPKSGNTWLRNLMRAYLWRLGLEATNPLDIHRCKDIAKESRVYQVDRRSYVFYKSHIPFSSKMRPNRAIYVYRHPLDVFVSMLNWCYLNKRAGVFISEIPKSVDAIKRDDEMEFYFERFLNNLGAEFYKEMLGEYGSIDKHFLASDDDRVKQIRYEDLFYLREDAFRPVIKWLFGEAIDMYGLFDAVDTVTKHSGSAFYWRAQPATHREYLSLDMILEFKRTNSTLLRDMGYLE